ncbi:hypothetical protein B0H17DRAFT_1199604 [Mycena rosella]|uniref:Uncharacterized protein n=1 Tax=Mycena rosella TaxID=1033263 RepID=A0AAD7DL96_MYCRO|nr:hypothetical protein B0H17DRAFT_1199604 [Mycena rosella]
MIPLIPALALAFLSFFCSVFVILRIVIPILPPHPLSRRVAPAEFGLPNFRSLSPADKSHIWLAGLDILALALFIWQTINEYTGGPSDAATALDPASSLRLWIALTLRQTCLLIVAGLTLLHVRMGRSVSFGVKHWMLWTPAFLLVATSTGIAVVLSGAQVPSLFIGLASYTTTIAIMSSIAFCCLVGTLLAIKRNLAIQDESEPWPPVRQMEQQPRPSFATEEVDAIRDGASWITSNASNASSRHNSVSAWSFSTRAPSNHHGGRAQGSSVPAKSSFWFSNSTPADAPPVPPLPPLSGPLSPTAQSLSDPDPFRLDPPRQRLDSQTSWLTSTNGSQKTVSAWSYPTTMHPADEHESSSHNGSSNNLNAELLPSNTAVTRPSTPAMANAKVLGGYGFGPVSHTDAEKSLAALAAAPGATLDISVYRAIGWLVTIWVPLALSLPYLLLAPQNSRTPAAASILLILSVTLSSPLLALNLLFRSPLPIPHGLFDIRGELPANVVRGPSRAGSTPTFKWSHEYKRSTSASVTVVEGRRSGDVWVANGDAVDGKGRVGRALGLVAPRPKLSVLPPDEEEEGQRTPPLPMQEGDSSLPITVHNSTQDEVSAQFGRLRNDSKASSRVSGADESLAYASRIMVAQRHYSALAQTVVVPSGGSPEKSHRTSVGGHLVTASGVGPSRPRHSAHLRTRSGSSIQHGSPTTESFDISPPPSFPLPPTPPNVRAARLAHLKHKKSFSSGFSFGAVDDMNEIDALTAGLLPLLVPGLTVGENMRIKGGEWTPPTSFSRAKGKGAAARVKRLNEFGEDFSSPEVHSTPARTRARQAKKTAMHKRHHFSLPSLSLGKDGVHSLTNWKDEISRALELGQYTAFPSNVDIGRRATVFGAESIPNTLTHPHLHAVAEEEEEKQQQQPTRLTRGLSSRRLGLQSDVPHDAHLSVDSFSGGGLPASAASTATLFDFEAGMDSGPQAESTPHNTVSTKPTSKQRPPPLPLPVPEYVRAQTKSSRRSSIVYISSPDAFSPTASTPAADVEPTTPSTMSALAQWSSRVIAKPGKLQRKISDAVYGTTQKPGSPGLRPLALLQDRDTNADGGTPPLSLRKKQNKVRGAVNDENAAPGAAKRSLKPLQLVRTETRLQHV